MNETAVEGTPILGRYGVCFPPTAQRGARETGVFADGWRERTREGRVETGI